MIGMIDSVPVDPIIKGILDYPNESRSVELKPSIPWNDMEKQEQVQDIVKSILGMSNIRDGGKIVLGVRQNSDRTFEVTGMTDEYLRTYDPEKIYQDVRSYGEPEPRFEIRNMKYSDKYFIVFLVQEFLYSPVICRKNGKNIGKEPLVKGALYIRTHKPGTKKVDNETEMKEIIDLAVEKELGTFWQRERLVSEGKKGPTNAKRFLDEIRDII